MQAPLSRALKAEFAFAAGMREEDILYREKMARFEARQKAITENERIAGEKRDREFADFSKIVFASERQITQFTIKLDSYDEKTIEALMENGAELDVAKKRVGNLLDNAHVLPDGRLVYKTRDGLHVLDERGLPVSGDVIEPDMIDDARTRWEDFKTADDAKSRLLKERQELIEFQAKSDAAREELDQGSVTAERLDELDADLKDAMPEAVRRKLGNEGPTRDAEAAPPGPSNNIQSGASVSERRLSGFSPM